MTESSQKEAEKLQYSLRSSFFYRKRKIFPQFVNEVEKVIDEELDWSEREEIGITKTAWEYITTHKIKASRVFAHPDLIEKNIPIIAYYRSISGISQKGMSKIAHGTKTYEEGRGKPSKKRITRIITTINSYISALIDSDPDFNLEDTRLLGMLNYGTQINGSWRNEIGIEGDRRVKELLLKYFIQEKKVKTITEKSGREKPATLPPEVDEIQSLTTTNDYKIIFGSEPDVSIRNPQGKLEASIEVKAGIDTAGALERYGAAKKSFDKVLGENKAAETIYLASCITDGVKKAMENDRLVKRDFNLTDTFIDEKAKEEFLAHIKWLIHL